MIGKKVKFRANGDRLLIEGIIMDKVNVPIASGTNEYCPMDNYVINANGNIYVVNPIFIDVIID